MRPLYTALPLFVFMVLCAHEAFGYPVPDIKDAAMVFEEKQIISDRDPPTEILIRTYKRADGTHVRQYGVAGNVFRYDVDEDGRMPYEYRLLDGDGDGSFETRELLVGEMVIDDKGQRYFVDLGAEPGKEYHYEYEEEMMREPTPYEHRQIIRGYSIYIPQWVLVRF